MSVTILAPHHRLNGAHLAELGISGRHHQVSDAVFFFLFFLCFVFALFFSKKKKNFF
jgi:hypothetical protein